ncbi:ABC transporter ATP-binding protein [Shewanella dokdonensis]|uniref:ABC transporter ATP-binding protein n=1 Tax=Shewanella dokdonensis TaxID=712036 RepID=UPI00201001C1|nr:ABC transporter ATP-binding protein [Shewanella dokdonensis]MCL1076180.1 ABC transporter ATP-binding protein [Shewanella dokdonensis]
MNARGDLQVRIAQLRGIPLQAEFSCRAGELLAVVGPSGGGKTTLLRMIAGLNQPQSGEIRCGEQLWFADGINLSPQQRHLGYVPQHYGLFPNLSAQANVMAGLDHLPKAQRRQRAQQWLERVNLQGLPERLPHQLSGGQKQRVALARALAREPSVLLLDEPFSALDRETRERLYIELARLKRQLQIPVIMVTHDINEALLLADKLVLISQGQMLQQGEPRQVLLQPRNEAVARQMGLRNIFDAKMLQYDAQQQLQWMQFGEQKIACDADPRFSNGDEVRWVIPNQGIRFNAISSGRLSRSYNKLSVTIDSLLVMGESVRLVANIAGVAYQLHAEVPLHLVQQLALTEGLQTEVALKSDLIHLLEHEASSVSSGR